MPEDALLTHIKAQTAFSEQKFKSEMEKISFEKRNKTLFLCTYHFIEKNSALMKKLDTDLDPSWQK